MLTELPMVLKDSVAGIVNSFIMSKCRLVLSERTMLINQMLAFRRDWHVHTYIVNMTDLELKLILKRYVLVYESLSADQRILRDSPCIR